MAGKPDEFDNVEPVETAPLDDMIFSDEPTPYFILHGKDSTGPYTPDDIRRQLASGEVRPSSYCWNQTMPEWLPLHAVFDFAMGAGDTADDGATAALAGFGRRFVSGLIDLVSVVIIFELSMFLLPPFRAWVEVSSVDPTQLLKVNLLLGAIVYLYFLLALGPVGNGATLGYRLCHLQLVDQATRIRPSWTQALLWCLGSISLPVGWPFYWFDRQHRMLHNGISQTLVLDISNTSVKSVGGDGSKDVG